MKLKFSFFICFVFISSSCSRFLNQLDKESKNYFIKEDKSNKVNYCANANETFYTTNYHLNRSFLRFYKKFKKRKFKPVDWYILYSIAHLFSSPHIVSPTSFFLVIKSTHTSADYYNIDFKSSDTSTPFFHGLSYLLKLNKSRYNLRQLFNFFVDNYTKHIPISKQFANFLETNQEFIISNSETKKLYMRSNESLQVGEGVSVKARSKSYLKYIKTSYKIKNNKLLKYIFKVNQQPGEGVEVNCNLDLELYQRSIYPIAKESTPTQHYAVNLNGIVFMSAVSQRPVTEDQYVDNGIFLQTKNEKSNYVCFINKDKKLKHVLLSSASRDPGQNLYHLIKYDFTEIDSIKRLDSLLKFSRHMFLFNPPRLYYESDRGSKKQLKELLKLDFPIYYRDQIGMISAIDYTSTPQILADDRIDYGLSCK